METFDWLKPSPLWQQNGRDLLLPDYRDTFRQPQMLAFRSDDFVNEFFAVAAAGDDSAFPIARNDPLMTSNILKLFQPAHGRFYLVAASLCCIRPGFPDRAVRQADEESVYFVLRKQMNGQEYGWVLGPTGPVGWRAVPTNQPILAGEERMPLAFTTCHEGRKLVFGYVPVASREGYPALPSELPGTPVGTDARIMELQSRFTAQLPLIDAVQVDDPQADRDTEETALRLSIYMMLDLWEYLQTYLPAVGQAILDDNTASLDGEAAQLASFLNGEALGGGVSLREALTAIAQDRAALNDLGEDDLPDPFEDETGGVYDYSLRNRNVDTATLEDRVEQALAEADEASGIDEAPVTVPKLRPDTGETFVIRCVYDRPLCREKRYWVSQPSVPFQMASFFDPDAPVRPVRIPLPDMSMSNLRRFKKGVGFIMSPDLQQKINGIGPAQVNMLDSQNLIELGLGFMCTFSIPIITLCAFILLLILVIILHLVFWWIPFFKICLPVPTVE
jgi:hypothetical protein